MKNYDTNIFQIYLNSADAIQGAATPQSTTFNIGSILQNAPNWERFENAPFCTITMEYFSIARTPAQFTADGVESILVNLNNNFPNNLRSQGLVAGQPFNFISSQIIGIVSTGNTANTYGNYNYSSVISGNIFNGTTSITLIDQDYTAVPNLVAGTPWHILLNVEFPSHEYNFNENKLL